MAKFKVGDVVRRTNCSFDSVHLGRNYIISQLEDMMDELRVSDLDGVELQGRYAASNFKLVTRYQYRKGDLVEVLERYYHLELGDICEVKADTGTRDIGTKVWNKDKSNWSYPSNHHLKLHKKKEDIEPEQPREFQAGDLVKLNSNGLRIANNKLIKNHPDPENIVWRVMSGGRSFIDATPVKPNDVVMLKTYHSGADTNTFGPDELILVEDLEELTPTRPTLKHYDHRKDGLSYLLNPMSEQRIINPLKERTTMSNCEEETTVDCRSDLEVLMDYLGLELVTENTRCGTKKFIRKLPAKAKKKA